MKKLLAMMLSLLCIFSLAACTTDQTTDGSQGSAPAASDYDYIASNGKLVIGITLYEPMNYNDENGELTGFDTEFAQAVCEKLGLEPEFQVIDWDMKESELSSRNIDCIWNGLTVTEERRENMDFSMSYLTNKQCVVINSSNADTYTDTASLASAMLSAEGGSAGEDAILADESLAQASYTASDSQASALLALKSGNYDAIVIDYTLATASAGTGDYTELMIVDSIQLANEEYAIGFRLGSDMTEKVNAVIRELIDDGTLASLADKYDMTELYEEAVGK
ncbi:MAG: transporter substrate-binding domain-containing protein [Lachnospiraceae bacterium]|nr:transporter substrate-binding domain-containing protein [Lachnospiraceae bacterium]